MDIKTIAILTSGGDAPGMNAAIRAVTRYAICQNIRVFGVRRGFQGLRTGDIFEMNLRTVSDILHRGGTVLYSSRDKKFETQEGIDEAVEACKKFKIDAVIIIGGDGTLKGANVLSKNGINCIFIPATIDNDVACTGYCIGFDTAMNTAMEMVDKIRDTAQSHEKCSVVEVMGRRCGDIALRTGIAVGATAILIPEIKYNFENDVINRIKFTQNIGKRHFIVIVAEGSAKAPEIAQKIEAETGIYATHTVLGHVQRGGSPTLRDRVVASTMACHAIDTFLEGKKNFAVISKCNHINDIDLDEAVNSKKTFNLKLYNSALHISI